MARFQAHNLKVAGSNPAPATTLTEQAASLGERGLFVVQAQLDHSHDLAHQLDLHPVLGGVNGVPVLMRRRAMVHRMTIGPPQAMAAASSGHRASHRLRSTRGFTAERPLKQTRAAGSANWGVANG